MKINGCRPLKISDECGATKKEKEEGEGRGRKEEGRKEGV